MTGQDIFEFILDPPNPPEAAIEMAAMLLIDTLGVAAGATALAPARIARDHAVRFHAAARPEDAATLLFDGRSASLPGAAFAAATQIDNLDAHDGLNPTKGHIGCAVVPALCAFGAQKPDLTGRDALRAMVTAYEVSARAATALHATVSDYHTSGAWNALGVAALGAHLRGLSRTQLRDALGIAEYHGPRSQMMREIETPTMLHDGSGMGAFVGTMATLLAEEGFEGAPAITVEAPEVADHWGDLGTRWTILENYIKPYPICRWAHAALDALDQLIRAHDLTPGRIAKIEVRTFAQAAALYAGVPKTTSQAQYSLPFALATLLVHGQIGPTHIDGSGLTNAQVITEMAKITVTEAPHHSERFPAGRWSDVTLTLTDGTTHRSGDVHAKGGPEVPMTRPEIEAKFHIMASPLDQDRRQNLWAQHDRLSKPNAMFSDLLTHILPPP